MAFSMNCGRGIPDVLILQKGLFHGISPSIVPPLAKPTSVRHWPSPGGTFCCVPQYLLDHCMSTSCVFPSRVLLKKQQKNNPTSDGRSKPSKVTPPQPNSPCQCAVSLAARHEVGS
jgi:hypothetical protein